MLPRPRPRRLSYVMADTPRKPVKRHRRQRNSRLFCGTCGGLIGDAGNKIIVPEPGGLRFKPCPECNPHP